MDKVPISAEIGGEVKELLFFDIRENISDFNYATNLEFPFNFDIAAYRILKNVESGIWTYSKEYCRFDINSDTLLMFVDRCRSFVDIIVT